MLMFAAEKANAGTKFQRVHSKLHAALKPHPYASDRHWSIAPPGSGQGNVPSSSFVRLRAPSCPMA